LNALSALQKETARLLINWKLQHPEEEHDTAAPNSLPQIVTIRKQLNAKHCFIGLRYGSPWERSYAAKELK
jgi:hypothetical protein